MARAVRSLKERLAARVCAECDGTVDGPPTHLVSQKCQARSGTHHSTLCEQSLLCSCGPAAAARANDDCAAYACAEVSQATRRTRSQSSATHPSSVGIGDRAMQRVFVEWRGVVLGAALTPMCLHSHLARVVCAIFDVCMSHVSSTESKQPSRRRFVVACLRLTSAAASACLAIDLSLFDAATVRKVAKDAARDRCDETHTMQHMYVCMLRLRLVRCMSPYAQLAASMGLNLPALLPWGVHAFVPHLQCTPSLGMSQLM